MRVRCSQQCVQASAGPVIHSRHHTTRYTSFLFTHPRFVAPSHLRTNIRCPRNAALHSLVRLFTHTQVKCPIPRRIRARFPFTPQPRTCSTIQNTALICSDCVRLATFTAASWYATPLSLSSVHLLSRVHRGDGIVVKNAPHRGIVTQRRVSHAPPFLVHLAEPNERCF